MEGTLVVVGRSGPVARAIIGWGQTAFPTVITVGRGGEEDGGGFHFPLETLGENTERLRSLLVSPVLVTITTGAWKGTTQQLVETNLTVPLMAAQTLAPLMTEGLIVFFGDSRATSPLKEGSPAYYGAKAGLRGVVASLAVRLAPSVRVNLLELGPVSVLSKGSEERWASQTLTRALVSTQDVIRAVQFLWNSPSVTGSVLQVDGGFRLGQAPG